MFTSILDQPFVDLYQFSYPEFGPTWIVQVKDNKQQPSHSHLKAMIYNNLDGTDGQLHRGEVILALRLMAAQLRRLRFIKHSVAPVCTYPSILLFRKDHIQELTFKSTRFSYSPSWDHNMPALSRPFSRAPRSSYGLRSYMIFDRKTKLRSDFLRSGILGSPLVIRWLCRCLLVRCLSR